MMLIAKDKHQTIDNVSDISVEEADAMGFYLITDAELESKIQFAYPDFEFVLSDGVVTDIVTDKVPEPTIEEKITMLEEENQMLVDCILEMSEIVYGG